MINYVEIFLNEPATTKLDLNQEFDISLQYSIADIRDITKRNAAFSKTIILPGTKNNNYWLGNLYDINADFTFFNPNLKTPCTILVNSEVVMKGFLQLRKIKKLVNVDHQGNLIYYEVVIFNNAVDLMTELGERTLNQLQLPELDHTYTKNNIVYSWTQSWTNGWVYPMYGLPTTTSNVYAVTDFYPAYYSKYLLNAIFQEAGFGWTGSLGSNPQFEREIIPWVGSGSQSISQDLIDAENFRAGITQSFTYSNNFFLLPPPITTGNAILSRVGVDQFRPSWTYSLPADNFQDPFNPNDNLYDNGNDWDTTTSVWTTTQNRVWAPLWQANYDLEFKNISTTIPVFTTEYPTSSSQGAVNATQFQLEITHTVEYQLPSQFGWNPWPNGTNTIIKTGWTRIGGTPSPTGINPQQVVSEQILSFVQCAEFFVPAGTKVRLRVQVQPAPNVNRYQMTYTGQPVQNSQRLLQMTINYRSSQNYLFSNGIATAARELDIIESTSWLNPKIKQKDFITDLIKRYNLFISVSPENQRLLILDTRQDFYDKVLNLDWTKKKDFSSEDEITLLSELQFKEMLFTMKPDTSDQFNKDYTALTGDVYGQYKYIFTNDFVKGEQKIESPFSPTPLIKTGFGAVVPAISPQEPKVNPRVLYWGGLKSSPQVGFNWQLTSFSQGSQFFTQYPYAGHFDDPLNPSLDIHFGTPAYLYYWEYGILPTDTMYETYWASYVNQIEDGKLVKSRFYLDEFDIQTIKDNFWARIFVLDSYYYVNKIIDYKPMAGNLTTVELIKIKEGFAYKKKPGKTASIVRQPIRIKDPVQIGNFGINDGIGLDGGIVIGNNNTGGGKVVVGSFSFAKHQFILGDNNFVSGDNSGVIGGSNNQIQTSNSWAIQSSNVSIQNDNVISLGVDNFTFSEPYIAQIGLGIKGDTVAKPANYPETYTKGINLNLDGYDLGQSDWRYIQEEREVVLQTGKQAKVEDISINGHYSVQGGTGTFSIGSGVITKRALSQVQNTMNIDGILSVYGEVAVGPPNLTGIGVFYSLQDQVATASTATQILLDTTNISQEVSINTNSQIVIDYPAAYRMSVTILLESLSGSVEDVIFWLKFNGVDYPYSGHFTSMPARKSAGVPSDTLFSYEFIGKSTSPNDYVELWWWTTSSDVKLKTRTVVGFPQSPSVVVNINKIA